jgi:hypothetical protein
MKTVFLRVLAAEDKAAALLGALREPDQARGRQRFEVDPASFVMVPSSPFAYWVSERLRRLFKELPPFEAEGRGLSIGASTKNDFRYVRTQFEVLPESIARSRSETAERSWVAFAKGGVFSPFYADIHLLIHWLHDGTSLKADITEYRGSRGWGYQWSAALNGHDHYFRPGLTWPRRTNGLSFRALSAGCIFADKGPAAFVVKNNADNLLALGSLTNSAAFGLLVSLQLARTELAQSYEVGLIESTPVPRLIDADRDALARLAHRAWSLKHSLDTRTETSHAFAVPALLQVPGADLAVRATAWLEHVRTFEVELAGIQAAIDDRCFTLYGIEEADRRAITEGFGGDATEVGSSSDDDEVEDDAGEDADENESTADATVLAAELASWAVGVAFGRFDVRLATGTRQMPTEPEPFDALPACSPGMLTGDDGLPLARPPKSYPLPFPETGVLVDDPGHAQDLPNAVRAVFDAVFGTDADRWWNAVAALLDPKGHDLRVWLASDFFEHHLKRHSKSRRKAPILWQLGTPSGHCSVWLYAHRLTRDSFFQLQNEVVGPKLVHEERQLTNLLQNAGGSPSASERKEIFAQESVVEELRTMLDEVKRVAPLWNPNLDDGVVLTMAPLWRLVPQHKPWQKELKSKWDELAAGKYDWAHIAMHLWPERVVPKCARDRSLAIAHGLEDVFWVEDADGKWKARSTPKRPIDELARERSSSAVKAALKGLLDAPTSSGTGRARGRRAAAIATAEGGNR